MFDSKVSKKTAVVTGGAGFLGSHLTDRLLAEGFRVIAIDNLITGSPENVAHLAGNPDFRFIRQNVSEYIFVPGKVDFVFHFASPASPIDYLEHPIPTLKVGALGTHNSLGLAKVVEKLKAYEGLGKRFEPTEQMRKAGLPTGGIHPFRPQLVRNRKGEPVIEKKAVAVGPKQGKRGYVDDQGRIWVKDHAHAGVKGY